MALPVPVVERDRKSGLYHCRVCQFTGGSNRDMDHCRRAGNPRPVFGGFRVGQDVGVTFFAVNPGQSQSAPARVVERWTIIRLYYQRPDDPEHTGQRTHEPCVELRVNGENLIRVCYMPVSELVRRRVHPWPDINCA